MVCANSRQKRVLIRWLANRKMTTGIGKGPMAIYANVSVKPSVSIANLFSNTLRGVSLQIVLMAWASTRMMDSVITNLVTVQKRISPVSFADSYLPVTGHEIE